MGKQQPSRKASQLKPRGRKRKLSNAAQALDIGEQDDDLMNESGS